MASDNRRHVITTVSSPYGAPMGRRRFPADADDAGRFVNVFRVRLNAGGYDDGGAYWGIGLPIYCADGGDVGRTFTRAESRADAVDRFKAKFPGARFRRSRD